MVWYKVLYLRAMKSDKLMSVAEYASHIGKSVPLVYKRIKAGKLKTVKRFGLILVKA